MPLWNPDVLRPKGLIERRPRSVSSLHTVHFSATRERGQFHFMPGKFAICMDGGFVLKKLQERHKHFPTVAEMSDLNVHAFGRMHRLCSDAAAAHLFL